LGVSLGDYKIKNGRELSTPDGNATYSWSIIHEALERGHQIFMMQQDRDWEAFLEKGVYDFASFSREKRYESYLNIERTNGVDLPDLDLLLVEWRFPIPGRNTMVDKTDIFYQPDLDRQTEILKHYKQLGTKIVLWDLDHKLTEEDEKTWCPDMIVETSVEPRRLTMDRVRIEPPIIIEDLLQHPTVACDPKKKLAYIGSRYERDDVIEQYIKPVSDRFPNEVQFWGNWTREETLREVVKLWPNISYNDRICTRDFGKVYNDAVACPLLGKRGYMKTGFITPRIWEALIFGTIPIGFKEFNGINSYLPATCIVENACELGDAVESLSTMSTRQRDNLRRYIVEMISFMDVSYLINILEGA